VEPAEPIQKPQLLDPNRTVDPQRDDMTVTHEDAAKELREALEKTCEYGRQLWDHLDAVRHYLMDSLPPDPRSAGPHTRVSARPTGPDDTEGWSKWVDIYASVTSVLAGPHGDSGFGYGEARDAARIRSEAPNARLAARLHDELHGDGTFGSSPAPERAAAAASKAAREVDTGALLKGVGLAALGVLALRGLSPRR
jgi:hypothetical protein